MEIEILQSEPIKCISEDDINRASLFNEHLFDFGINHHSQNYHRVIIAEDNTL